MNTSNYSNASKIFFLSLWLFASTTFMQAQVTTAPIYKGCENKTTQSTQQDCFLEKVKIDFDAAFQFPENLEKTNFSVLFSALKDGSFQVLYSHTKNESLKEEVKRVFANLPNFKPASYNGHAIDQQFVLPYHFENSNKITTETRDLPLISKPVSKVKKQNKKYQSNLFIPLSHQTYNRYADFYFDENTHTSVKPYTYSTISKSIALENLDADLKLDKTSWFGRKFWNENMLNIQGDNYWFHLDPIADLQIGKDNSSQKYTFNNTRAIKVEGGLGDKINFSSSISESQGRFANYFNSYARTLKPAAKQAYAVVPGRDVSKIHKPNGFDYPLATGYINYSPTDYADIQFGHDKNFIGDGYRSLFLSDVGAPYTFLKISTKFWNIQYTNLWTWLRDVDTPTPSDDPYKRKYMAIHHLSWNATKNLNFGLFESVTWSKTADRGFDVQYLNPVIIYRAMEYANGSTGGNAMIGLSAKYRFKQKLQFYSQFILDELTMKEFVKGDGYWANKYGIQAGAKYFDAFNISGLTLQGEYNLVRPYTYSHSRPSLNYGHVNQPLAHLWGSNFKEFTAIADYKHRRWFATAKLTTGSKGFDVNSDADSYSYGGDIFRFYTERNANYGIKIGQGNKAKINIAELQVGYLLNPATNLKLFGSVLYRNFKTPLPDPVFENKTTSWFNLGFRTDINNWYFDF